VQPWDILINGKKRLTALFSDSSFIAAGIGSFRPLFDLLPAMTLAANTNRQIFMTASEPRKTRVLVADDSEPVRLLLASMLEALGYEVVEAQDGGEAYASVLAGRIQIVVSDWQMPGLDGLSLCRKLRGAGLDYYVFFILVSVRDSPSHYLEGMDAGADDFLFKPVDIDQLRVRLRAGRRLLELERKLAERNRELTLAYEQIKKDMAAASRMHELLEERRDLPPQQTLDSLQNTLCQWRVDSADVFRQDESPALKLL
jgi:sigma-B regulation protein RsbU (phosphoserine phosphatase)